MRNIITILLLMVLVVPASGREMPVSRFPGNMPAAKIVGIDEPYPDVRVIPPKDLQVPRRDDLMGEAYEVGDTYYDYQSNGCIGKFIAMDAEDNLHFTWMDAYFDNLDNTRKQKYNYLQNEEFFVEDGVIVDEGDRSGYGCLWQTNHDESLALIFAHVSGGPYPDGFNAFTAVDLEAGAGAFLPTLAPDYPDDPVAWPQGVLSPENKIHVVCNYIDVWSHVSYYTAEIDDFGEVINDHEVPILAGQSHLNSYRIARSPHSERVAIAYMKPRVGLVVPEEWDGFAAYQMNNDLMLVWSSEDGDDWNFNRPYNVTQCQMPDIQAQDDAVYGDTLLPYNNFDLIFDENDNIHIVFQTLGVYWNPNLESQPPVDGLTIDAGFLFHWTEEDCTFSVVADGWHSQTWIEGDSLEADTFYIHCDAWKSNVCYPSLAYDDDGNLYCVYNYYPPGDFNLEVTDGISQGRPNGNIAVTMSDDNGINWYLPNNIVETESHLAEAGEAMCEQYPTIAERIDDYLHIMYEIDTQAGTPIQDAEGGAIATDCKMIYQKVPLDTLVWEEYLDTGVEFHVETWQSVDRVEALPPSGFALSRIYPNPFNGRTSIEFKLQTSAEIVLDMIDMNGRSVATLVNGKVSKGSHKVSLEADSTPAGVYFVRLSSGNDKLVQKVALVK